MENYVGMNELVEIIFGKKSTISEQKVEHSSIPSSFLTKDFQKKLGTVLFLKILTLSEIYGEFFIGHLQKVLSSHEDYLMYAMSVFLREHEDNENIFDSFIGVCAFVKYISQQTLVKTGVDFCELNSDIFMVFYRKVLKTAFLKQKGFYRFFEYIGTHKYLERIRNAKGKITYAFGHNQTITIDSILYQKINVESRRYHCFRTFPIETKTFEKVTARSLAQEVLSSTLVDLPSLPNESDLISRLVAYKKKEIANEAERKKPFESALEKEILNGNSSFNHDAETSHFTKQQESISRHETIIQAVIRHNHSKNINHESANCQISKEANGILEHLKDTIESLAKVLDEYNK